MLRVSVALAFLLLGACTTAETDRATNSALYNTRVDFNPPTRLEREQQIAFEKKVLEQKEQEFHKQIDEAAAEREEIFRQVSKKFPECRSQRHCLSDLSRGSVEKFEAYREARKPLAEADSKLAEAEENLALWRRRYDLRVRAIYNRYLVRELLEVKSGDERIRQVLLHSAESFPTRRHLSQRLLELAAPDVLPGLLVGDLDFRMLGQPVDEAAVLLTLEVATTSQKGQPERFLVTLLVNTHQLDPQVYEQGFIRAWGKRLGEPGQRKLREDTFCGLYSIASPMLLPKLGSGKPKYCSPLRERFQALHSGQFLDRDRPDHWALPVAFRALSGQ